jgi:hypothetical protein
VVWELVYNSELQVVYALSYSILPLILLNLIILDINTSLLHEKSKGANLTHLYIPFASKTHGFDFQKHNS